MSDSKLPEPAPKRGWGLSTIAAITFLMLGMGLMLAIPGFIGLAVVVGGVLFFGMIAFHYFVWGRWLGEMLRREAEDDVDL